MGRLDIGAVEEHRRVRQLLRHLPTRLVWGAPGQGQDQVLPGRADLDPALIPVRLVAAKLEAEAIDPELLGPLLIVDGHDDLADSADHRELLCQ
jgi:hypothetical protein